MTAPKTVFGKQLIRATILRHIHHEHSNKYTSLADVWLLPVSVQMHHNHIILHTAQDYAFTQVCYKYIFVHD